MATDNEGWGFLIAGVALLVFVGYQLISGRFFYSGAASEQRDKAPISYWMHLGVETALGLGAICQASPLISRFFGLSL